MAASPLAETTGVAVRCRTPRAVNAPGMLAWERQRRTRRPASCPAAGRPGMARGGRRPRRRGYAQLRSPLVSTKNQAVKLRLSSNPRSLMHTLLSWQLKNPQTGTSEHELKERACRIALSALLRGRAGGDPHELRLLARRSRPGVRSTRPGPYAGSALRRNPDMFSMAVAAMCRRRIAAAAALAAALIAPGAAAAAAAAPAAQASVSHPALASGYGGSRAGNAALNWAEGHARGCWYSYGGSSCSPGYDCSGLVMAAFGHGAGVWLPHSTYSMLGSRHLHRISLSQARRGDLMFYGSGHVEINTIWYHQTFGAHHSGQRVGWR